MRDLLKVLVSIFLPARGINAHQQFSTIRNSSFESKQKSALSNIQHPKNHTFKMKKPATTNFICSRAGISKRISNLLYSLIPPNRSG